MRLRDLFLYTLGGAILLFAAVAGRDLSDPEEQTVVLLSLVGLLFLFIVWYWLRKQGLFRWAEIGWWYR